MPKKSTSKATIYKPPIVWAAGLYVVRTGKTYMFDQFSQPRIRIGRRVGCEIQLDDPRVSEVHAIIEFRANREVVLHNAGATNGILINGGPMFGPAHFESRTVLHLGRSEIRTVNKHGLIPITAHSIGEFCHLASLAYGGHRRAAAKLQAAYGEEFCYEFIRTKGNIWKRDHLYGRQRGAGKSARESGGSISA